VAVYFSHSEALYFTQLQISPGVARLHSGRSTEAGPFKVDGMFAFDLRQYYELGFWNFAKLLALQFQINNKCTFSP